jgi:hypothetical protein
MISAIHTLMGDENIVASASNAGNPLKYGVGLPGFFLVGMPLAMQQITEDPGTRCEDVRTFFRLTVEVPAGRRLVQYPLIFHSETRPLEVDDFAIYGFLGFLNSRFSQQVGRRNSLVGLVMSVQWIYRLPEKKFKYLDDRVGKWATALSKKIDKLNEKDVMQESCQLSTRLTESGVAPVGTNIEINTV